MIFNVRTNMAIKNNLLFGKHPKNNYKNQLIFLYKTLLGKTQFQLQNPRVIQLIKIFPLNKHRN